jgi:hypothetical protein
MIPEDEFEDVGPKIDEAKATAALEKINAEKEVSKPDDSPFECFGCGS